ncbi:MAG: ECF-type sigma factor [Lysobacteraceae bacterium]
MQSRSPITSLLNQAAAGDEVARDQVFERTYDELHGLARHLMRRERATHTLSPTALVHELYLRLFRGGDLDFEGREQFLRYARTAMAHLLVDHARRRNSLRRGGELKPLFDNPDRDDDADSLANMDQALGKLARVHPRAAKVLEIRCLAGLDVDQTAELLGTSVRTVCRDWDLARALLSRMLESPALAVDDHSDA